MGTFANQNLEKNTLWRYFKSIMKKILLHCCCAPCASSCIERLQQEGYEEVILFFSNCNIAPKAEYDLRLAALRQLAEICHLTCLEDGYDHEAWRRHIAGFENEPERGARCPRCFDFSFARASAKARELGIPFTSSLTVSPHKNSKLLFEVGSRYDNYEPHDFKKKDGFKRSRELVKLYGLYSQSYCGCEFSLRATSSEPPQAQMPQA